MSTKVIGINDIDHSSTDSGSTDSIERLRQLFNDCDRDKDGFIDR